MSAPLALALALALAMGAPSAYAGNPAAKPQQGETPQQSWDRLCTKQRTTMRLPRPLSSQHYAARIEYVLCADLTDDGSFIGPSTWNRADHPLPHSEVLLLVRARADQAWRPSVTGTRGTFRADVWEDESDDGEDDAANVTTGNKASATAGLAAPVLTNDERKELEDFRIKAKKPRVQMRNLHRFAPGSLDIDLVLNSTSPASMAAGLQALIAEGRSVESQLTSSAEVLTNKNDHASMLSGRLTLLDERLDLLETAHTRLAALEQSDQDTVNAAVTATTAATTTATLVKPPASWTDATEKSHLDALIGRFEAFDMDLRALIRATSMVGAPEKRPVANLIVDETYAGVIRLGMGFSTSLVTDSSFTTGDSLATGSSGVTVVQETFRGPGRLDLTTGYTHYLSRRAKSSGNAAVGLTAGLALASFDASGEVEVLDMAYVGGEWGWKEFGVALCMTLRRGEQLRDGLQVGQAVDAPSDPADLTLDRYLGGLSLVIYPPATLFRTGTN